ncbi:hypothetical protein [Duganella sp. Root198D2]|uniref:hypothetical protein n=1 Tax=Duganella sp. Root198D2 TaxID=1736489 RepID=UPI000A578ED0|nr:hypothetical protein [Duganella sp. Root198D2]
MKSMLILSCLLSAVAIAQEQSLPREAASIPTLRNAEKFPGKTKSYETALERTEGQSLADRFRMAERTKPTLEVQFTNASAAKERLQLLPRQSYTNAATLVKHQQLVGQFQASAKFVEERQARYSRVDLAMTKYLLANANVEAMQLESKAFTKSGGINDADLAALRDATVPLHSMQARISQGQEPLQHRDIKVMVLVSETDAKQMSGLRVYALPKDMFHHPERFPVELVEDLLVELSFEKLASPSEARMPVSDLRVWVGPKDAFKAMLPLIRGGKIQFAPVHANMASTGPAELTFYEGQVVKLDQVGR